MQKQIYSQILLPDGEKDENPFILKPPLFFPIYKNLTSTDDAGNNFHVMWNFYTNHI